MAADAFGSWSVAAEHGLGRIHGLLEGPQHHRERTEARAHQGGGGGCLEDAPVVSRTKNIFTRHSRATNIWQRTAPWNDATGVDWVGLKCELERKECRKQRGRGDEAEQVVTIEVGCRHVNRPRLATVATSLKTLPMLWLLAVVTTPKDTDLVSLNGCSCYFKSSEDGKPRAVLGVESEMAAIRTRTGRISF